ncbi:MAG TPA: hypothetical protein VIL46_07020 [Gemmataceae bacterium]
MPENNEFKNPFGEPSPEELRRFYEEAKRNFTAEDLAAYCTEEEGVPAEQVLADLEALYQELKAQGLGE